MLYGFCGCEDLELQFYHGNEFLGKAAFDDQTVKIDDEYDFKGGILKDLHDEMMDKMGKALEKWEDEMIGKKIREEQSKATNK